MLIVTVVGFIYVSSEQSLPSNHSSPPNCFYLGLLLQDARRRCDDSSTPFHNARLPGGAVINFVLFYKVMSAILLLIRHSLSAQRRNSGPFVLIIDLKEWCHPRRIAWDPLGICGLIEQGVYKGCLLCPLYLLLSLYMIPPEALDENLVHFHQICSSQTCAKMCKMMCKDGKYHICMPIYTGL